MSDNIVHLDFGRQTAVAAPTMGKGKCYHRCGVTLDEETRTVQCRCGASLDAFTVLLEYAERERNWRYYDSEAREAQERLQALKEEERKVKARTAGASRKDSAAAVAEERAKSERERIAISDDIRDIQELCRRVERRLQRRRTV